MEAAESFGSGEGLNAVIDVLSTPVSVTDQDNRLVLVNDAFCTFVGRSKADLIGCFDYEIFPKEQAEILGGFDPISPGTKGDVSREARLVGDDGRIFVVVANKRAIEVGGSVYIVSVLTDITAYRQAEAHSKYLALHDSLSGLPNRVFLQDKIEKAMAQPQAFGLGGCLLCINLDRFVQVNDAYGYPTGDELIREFATRLQALVRSMDTVARLGGDGFAILLMDVRSKDAVSKLCRRILRAAQAPYTASGVEIKVGVSIGVVAGLEEVRSSAEALRRGDVALNVAKSEGGGRYRIYHEEMDAGRRNRVMIEAELRDALRSGMQLEVYYQPQISGEIISGVEALVRWNHPRLGLLGPAGFLPVAEESGLIIELGDFVLNAALTALRRWPDFRLAVNLSAIQLSDPQLARRIVAGLKQHGVPPERLELEITETAMLTADAATKANLRKLRDAGIRIALDDFGTGYSSLSHLQDIEIDRIKIDRSFIRNLGGRSDSAPIVQAVMYIARILGLDVIAEGVETEEQHRFLVEVGCNDFQGFLFSPPVPESQISGKSASPSSASN
ncbi:sensor domain-containing protein [Microbaculum marinum]|uniref:EAL domain-containing protein n=1 Tax=Microbaculum marinum TaxID=1764581 RepID=A0AAW9RB12_9HYPH